MLHAAAMLIGLLVLWFLLVGAPRAPADYAYALLAGAVIVALTRFWSGRAAALASPNPQAIMRAMMRTPEILLGAAATMRAALAADVTLKPGLVRVKLRSADDALRAETARLISMTPGSAVVDLDADGVLAHVLQEDAVDAAELGSLEARVTGGSL